MSNGYKKKKNNNQLANDENSIQEKKTSTYSYEKKKRLAKKISSLKRKQDMVKILEIIYEDNQNITENQMVYLCFSIN